MDKEVEMEDFQADFMESEARFPAMKTAWGTGKTMFVCCMKPVLECEKYPGNQWLIVRKEFTRLEDSTIIDFEGYTGLKVGSDKNVYIRGDNWPENAPDSMIMFRHGEQVNKVEVLQNMNLGGFSIEQAEEFETDRQFQMLRGRLRRKGVPHFGCISANANGHNWIWKKWIKKEFEKISEDEIKELMKESGLSRKDIKDAFDPKQYQCFTATTYDNKDNLPLDFIKDLARMKKESPGHYRRLVMNSDEDMDTEDKVIPYSAIIGAVGRLIRPLRPKKIVSCDPAEFGEDETVIYGIENGKITKRDIYFKKELSETSDRCFDMLYSMEAKNIVLDPIGIGAGLRSFMIKRASKEGITILSADGRLKASDSITYYNLRTEIWFNARKRFIDRTVCIPDDDDLLQEELSKVGYEIQSDKTRRVHRKDKIRKADYLGHSPGRAECLIMGLWAEDLIGYEDVRVSLAPRFKNETDMAKSYTTVSVL